MNNLFTGFIGAPRLRKLAACSGKLFALLAAVLVISGTAFAQVQIGSTNYTTLAAALTAINAGTHTGAITVLITGNTTETNQPYLNAGNVAPANWTSVTIRPSGGQRTITASSQYQNLYLNSASNVTVDGSLTAGGTTRDLTFANTGTDVAFSGNVVIDHGSNNVIKNVIMSASSKNISYSVLLNATSYATIQNCKIFRAEYGIVAQNQCSNITVTKNYLGADVNTDKISVIAIFWNNTPSDITPVNGYTISDNEINGVYNDAFNLSQQGIRSFGGINGTIVRNKIHNLNNQYASVGSYGIDLRCNTDNTTFNTLIADNEIYDITAPNMYAIGMTISRSSYVQIYHNTINMNNTGTCYSLTAGIWINPYSITNIKVKNNIVVNQMGVTGGKTYGFYHGWSTNAFTELDHNDYYINASSSTNCVGYFSGDQISLSNWQTATSGDANSSTTAPTFKSNTDLHLDGASIGNSSFVAPSVSAVTNDIDGETRNSTTYIGADEVSPILSLTQDLNSFSTPFCAGATVTTNAVAAAIGSYADGVARTITGTPTYTYEWYHNGTKMTGQTASSLTLSNVTAADAGQYYVITKLGGASVTSKTITVDIESPVVITSQPPSQFDICENAPSLDMSVAAAGTITGYQWQKETSPNVWADITGQTASTYTLVNNDPAQVVGRYRVVIKGPGHCGAASVNSDPINVNVAKLIANPKITSDVNPGNICINEDIVLTANVDGTVSGYQWQIFDNGQFVDLDTRMYPSADQKTFVIKNAKLENSGRYRVRIFGSPNCNLKELDADPVDVRVWPLFEIAQQPKSELVCYGSSVQLIVIAIGTVHKYQWQKDGKDITISENKYANSPILIMNNMNEKVSGTYTCNITVEDCQGLRDVTTIPALVYVLEDTKIMSVTQTQAVQVGGKASFEVKAHVQGAPTNYQVDIQWYRGNQPLQDNDRISGTKSSILTIVDVQPGDVGNDYWVSIGGLCGTASAKNIELITPGVNIKDQPTASVVKCEGETATLTVNAEITGGGKTLSYQWFRNGQPINDGGNISGAKTATLTITNLKTTDAATDYYVQVTVQPGNFSINSAQAAVTVDSKPAITKQPERNVALKANDKLTLTVEASGNNLNYQWYKDNAEITGANSASYVVDQVSESNEGIYTAKIWNNCGEVYTDSSIVSVTYYMIQLGVDDNNADNDMLRNEPNPFNGETTIIFSAEKGTDAQISITDLYGRQIAVVFNGASNGTNRVTFNAERYNLASGVYYYTLTTGGRKISRPMLLVK